MPKTQYNRISESKKNLPDSVELAKQESSKPKKAKEPPKVRLIRVIIMNGLNIRKAPGKENDIVGVLKYGASATISEIKKAADGTEWAKLATGKGWIMFQPNYVVEVKLTLE